MFKNLTKIKPTSDLPSLEQRLQKVKDINTIISSSFGPVPIGSLKTFQNITKEDLILFNKFHLLNSLSPQFTSSDHPLNLNSNNFDSSKDYRNFTSLSQFSDSNILYNIQTQCFSKSRLSLMQVNEAKNRVFQRLKAYKEACENGDENQVALIDEIPYTNDDSKTDFFHSFEFQFKKRIFQVAKFEGKISLSTIDYFKMQQIISSRKTPENLYVEKNTNIKKSQEAVFDTKHELVIASLAATGNTNYLYYITCDKSKKDIDNWLIGLGYTEIGKSPQSNPDLVIIDYYRKLYIYFDIKNCTLENVNKFLNFDDQLLVFFGHLSSVDRFNFLNSYKNKQILSLVKVINDINSTVDQKAEASLLHSKLVSGQFSTEELFNLDPFITNISTVTSITGSNTFEVTNLIVP